MSPDAGSVEAIVYKDPSSYQNLPTHGHLTAAVYLRLFATEYLDPSVEKVLYLDSDTIVLADLGELWQFDLGDAFLGAVPEPYDYSQRHPLGFGPDDLYINAGVMLLNLAKWRAERIVPKFLDFAYENKSLLFSLEQDVINSVLRGSIRDIGYEWNWQAVFPRFSHKDLGLSAERYAELRRHPKIVHFLSRYKPWYFRWQPHYKKVYYSALAQTPWRGYIPPDKKLRNVPVMISKVLQQKLEWYLPSVAKKLRGSRSLIDR
ncbi:Glycosyl transferase, family 8 [Granulicella sibirica]|uniref:Glycosyl transferase, family 8 n=1 Tax=Granulicella sibirica TaxID=2479048 RepID=A0A4Q0T8C9_9BACT|nr:Glycosyl transferase, family 8 [Granulicella sibirica]